MNWKVYLLICVMIGIALALLIVGLIMARTVVAGLLVCFIGVPIYWFVSIEYADRFIKDWR